MKGPELRHIPIEFLSRGKYQPRQDFAEDALTELAESIASSGLIQPIVIRPIDKDRYEIVAGERRWRAAQIAGLEDVPCLVKAYTDEQAAAVSTIENVNRVDLNPIEEAKAYARLKEDFGYLHDEIAAVVGKSRSKITNMLRLLKLDSRVQGLLIEHQLSEGHGKVIAGVGRQYQFELAQKCIQYNWSVRRTEQQAKALESLEEGISPKESINIKALETRISEQLGAKVNLEQDITKHSGWLKIRYFNNDTLAGLLDKIGIDYKDEE